MKVEKIKLTNLRGEEHFQYGEDVIALFSGARTAAAAEKKAKEEAGKEL